MNRNLLVFGKYIPDRAYYLQGIAYSSVGADVYAAWWKVVIGEAGIQAPDDVKGIVQKPGGTEERKQEECIM